MTDAFIDLRELDANTLRDISVQSGVIWPDGGDRESRLFRFRVRRIATEAYRRGLAQWQPIETAPKDGPILLRSKKGRIADGMWIAATDTRGGWAWALIHQEPTHWMPLPPEPDRARGAQGEST